MARVGGRNAAFAWVVGVACAATVGVLAFLAIPMIPASVSWLGDAVRRPRRLRPRRRPGGRLDGVPTRCADLYDAALGDADLRPGCRADGIGGRPDDHRDALVDALRPQVVFTCAWRADAGTVSTTLADVPTDAGPIAAAALPAAQGSPVHRRRAHAVHAHRRRPDGDDRGRRRSVAVDERAGWHPSEYVRRIAKRVWG
jgi:hypothetical protein